MHIHIYLYTCMNRHVHIHSHNVLHITRKTKLPYDNYQRTWSAVFDKTRVFHLSFDSNHQCFKSVLWLQKSPTILLLSQIHDKHILACLGCVREGCLYISGGHTGMGHTNAVSCLNPTLGEWVECAPLQCARSYHTMTAFKDQLFVIGGCSISSGEIINVQVSTQLNDVLPCLVLVICF